VLAIAIEGSSPSHSAKYPTQLEMDNLIPKDDDHIDWNTDPFEFAKQAIFNCQELYFLEDTVISILQTDASEAISSQSPTTRSE